jgi:hypothetical protein
MSSANQTQFLESSKLLLEKARGSSELWSVLSHFGYDEVRFDEGARILAECEALIRRQTKEGRERGEAGSEAEQSWAEFRSMYMKTLKVARVVFAEDATASATLKLYGPRKLSLKGLIEQATTLYQNLGPTSRLMPKMLRFGYSARRLEEEAALVEGLRARLQVQAKEMREALSSTLERDRQLHKLDRWVSELRAICRIAFYDAPRELEKLGLIPRENQGRKKAVARA